MVQNLMIDTLSQDLICVLSTFDYSAKEVDL